MMIALKVSVFMNKTRSFEYSGSREQAGQINGNRSSKKSTTERGTYVSKIGNKNMHAIFS
jgi:Mg-chelatase subunit ChlD